MVSVMTAVVQKARLVPVEASHDYAARMNWAVVGDVAALH